MTGAISGLEGEREEDRDLREEVLEREGGEGTVAVVDYSDFGVGNSLRIGVEPGTGTGFPFEAAEVAEFGSTAAAPMRVSQRGLADREGVSDESRVSDGHVVTTPLKFHITLTIIASLISFLFRRFDEFNNIWILRAISLSMSRTVTHGAGFYATFFTFSKFVVDSLWRDPFAAGGKRTVDAILGGKFPVFTVPETFSLVGEEVGDMVERDVGGGAAFGRHVGGIGEGKGEEADEAVVAEVVTAGNLGRD